MTSWRTGPITERKPLTAPGTDEDVAAETVQLPAPTERMRTLMRPFGVPDPRLARLFARLARYRQAACHR